MRPIHMFSPLAALALAACQPITDALDGGGSGQGVAVPEGEVRVVDASATPGRVTIRLSDGARCTADRPEGVPGGWSGVTADCGYALPYTVTFQQGAVAQRYTIEAATAGTGPRAEIFVTDVDGVRRLFTSPLGANVRFEAPGETAPAEG